MYIIQIQRLTVSQELHKKLKQQAAVTEQNFKIHLEELEKRYQDKLHQTECSLGQTEAAVQEFCTFTMV